MQVTRSLLVGAGLAALINPVTATSALAKAASDDQSSAEMAKELKALREQVEALQRRLDAQAAAEQKTKADAEAASAQAAAAKAETASIPAQVKSAIDAAKPKTDKIYYKGVTITPTGFIALESMYRSHNEQADIASSFSGIPLANSSLGQTPEFRFSARQTRLGALVQGDANADTHLSAYTEIDFISAAQTANSNESNSYNPRIRHLYSNIDWDDAGLHFLAGQSWSLATLNSKGITPRNEVLPPQIDAQYIPGFVWTRQPQVRLVKDFGKQIWLAVSLENPQTTFYAGANKFPATVNVTYNSAAGSGFNSANTLSLNRVPDVVAKIAAEVPLPGERAMHLEAFGLYRQFSERLNGTNQDATGDGVGAGLIVPLVPKVLDFQISGLVGKGIGRYGSSQLTDTTFDAGGFIHPISEVMALTGFTLHATPKLDLYLFAGEEKESAQAYNLVPATGPTVGYGYGNALYDNSKCGVEGGAAANCVGNTRLVEQVTTGFWYKPYVGAFGRYQWGLQYSYTQRDAFTGVGGTPIANDSMVFASFRYYPF